MEIVVEGEPKGKGRPRFTRTGHAYTPARTRDYEELIAARARQAMDGRQPIPKGVPVRMTILAVFGVPVSWPKKRRTAALQGVMHHTHKPDLDNVQKAVCDALNGIAYEDDSQIVKVNVEKVYGSEPMVRVFLEEATDGSSRSS